MPSINNSLNTAVTGLETSSDGMNIIANNIANANTRGFKTDRPEFEDQLAFSLGDNCQLGRGSRLKTVTTLHNQGSITNTGQLTDLAIQGDGFFAIRNNSSATNDSNGIQYTRQGSFRFDKEGKLTDPDGGRVQGYMADPDSPTKLSPTLSDLQIVTSNLPPRETTLVNVVANLDAREKAPIESFNPARPKDTSNFTTSVTIYDNYGTGRQAQIYFNRLPEEGNNWEWHAMIDGAEISASPEKDPVSGKVLPAVVAQGKLNFDANGNAVMPFTGRDGAPSQYDAMGKSDAININFASGSKATGLQFNFGAAIGEDGKKGTQGSTSIATNSGLIFHTQNGYEPGYLRTLRIEQDGAIRGVFSNGLEKRLGVVALASFSNNLGLQKAGRNNYAYTSKAGEPRYGAPQTGSRGAIFSSSLEESNVDLAQQFVNMITTQRAFQANSKSITTSDTMLDEVVNLKR